MKNICKLSGMKFKVLVNGEREQTVNFMGLIRLLNNWSDFFRYTPREQATYFNNLVRTGYGYIDANISVEISRFRR